MTLARQRCVAIGRKGVAPRRGFTLIELIISVAIVALLASGAMSLAELAVKRSREQELRLALRQIREGIDAYKAAADAKRIRIAADETGYPRSLDELVSGVPDLGTGARQGKLYFLRSLPRDPWADPRQPAAASWGLRSYASEPDNPQPGRDVYDVYSRARGNGLNGRPYRQW